MPYLAICAIFRDEAPYLREWIEFHKLVGAERFFLYDNESSDGSREIVESYPEVIAYDWPLHPGQMPAYNDCLHRHRDDARWIAFIDIDEFLFSPTGRPLPEVLREFEDFPGIGVNWAVFGTSGHVKKPDGLVIESYTQIWRNPKARRKIKSIMDPKRVVFVDNPHYGWYLDGFAVDENKQPIEGPDFAHTEVTSRFLLQVNHYWTKSEEEFREKLGRAQSHTGALRRQVEPQPGDNPTDAILQYVAALKSRS